MASLIPSPKLQTVLQFRWLRGQNNVNQRNAAESRGQKKRENQMAIAFSCLDW
jgi:hypothetical protein